MKIGGFFAHPVDYQSIQGNLTMVTDEKAVMSNEDKIQSDLATIKQILTQRTLTLMFFVTN